MRWAGKNVEATGVLDGLSFRGAGGGTDSRALDGTGGAGKSETRLEGTGGGGEGTRDVRWQSPPKVMLDGLKGGPVIVAWSLNENVDRHGVALEHPLSLAVDGRTMMPGRAVAVELILDAVSGRSSKPS